MREAYSAIQAAGGEAVLVTMSEPTVLHEFKQKWQLPFVCLADTKQEGYRAFRCPRGRMLDIIGPVMWWRAIKSLSRHGLGRPQGDVMQLPGSFVIDRGGTIRFAHGSQHSADWASPEELIAALKPLTNKS